MGELTSQRDQPHKHRIYRPAKGTGYRMDSRAHNDVEQLLMVRRGHFGRHVSADLGRAERTSDSLDCCLYGGNGHQCTVPCLHAGLSYGEPCNPPQLGNESVRRIHPDGRKCDRGRRHGFGDSPCSRLAWNWQVPTVYGSILNGTDRDIGGRRAPARPGNPRDVRYHSTEILARLLQARNPARPGSDPGCG